MQWLFYIFLWSKLFNFMFLVDLVQALNYFFTELKINFYLYCLEFAVLF